MEIIDLGYVKESVDKFVKKHATNIATEDAARVKKKLSEFSRALNVLLKQASALLTERSKATEDQETEKANNVRKTFYLYLQKCLPLFPLKCVVQQETLTTLLSSIYEGLSDVSLWVRANEYLGGNDEQVSLSLLSDQISVSIILKLVTFWPLFFFQIYPII